MEHDVPRTIRLSLTQDEYLKQRAKRKGLPVSVYIRDLIVRAEAEAEQANADMSGDIHIRVSRRTKDVLTEIAQHEHKELADVTRSAVELYIATKGYPPGQTEDK